MTGHILLAAALVFGILAVALLAAYVRALILAATRPGRHELGELQQPSEADVDEFLEALPPWEHAPRPAVYDYSMLPLPSAEPGPPIVSSITDVPDRRHGRAERLATDTDIRAIAGVLPAWVIEALNGHDGVDACVDSIVARAVTA